MLGSFVASAFFYILEIFNWTTANPGQDYDDLETQIVAPDKTTARPNVALQRFYSDNPTGSPVASVPPRRKESDISSH